MLNLRSKSPTRGVRYAIELGFESVGLPLRVAPFSSASLTERWVRGVLAFVKRRFYLERVPFERREGANDQNNH